MSVLFTCSGCSALYRGKSLYDAPNTCGCGGDVYALQRKPPKSRSEIAVENARLRARVEELEYALQRMAYRTEQMLDEMEKRSIRMPMWTVMTIQEALKHARAALSAKQEEGAL